MEPTRPDLNQIEPTVRSYIEFLEAEIERLKLQAASPRPGVRSRVRPETIDEDDELPEEIFEVAEPPTTLNVITFTAAGIAKRTPRHLYSRQRRGGMGVFDLDSPAQDPPRVLAIADASANLIAITSLSRAFRLPASAIPERPVRSKGEAVLGRFNLLPDETLAAVLPDQTQGYVALVSQRGYVRMLRHHVFGEYMKPGTYLFDPKTFGPLSAACWTPGDGDLFITTQQGKAIRFSEKLVPPTGGPGIRLTEEDVAVGITGIDPDSAVFMLNADGRGTIRKMEGFAPNKAPGAGGKVAINSDQLIFSARVETDDDIFIISKLGKIIRFNAGDIPVKDGVVQGVVCMSLRGDECLTATISSAAG